MYQIYAELIWEKLLYYACRTIDVLQRTNDATQRLIDQLLFYSKLGIIVYIIIDAFTTPIFTLWGTYTRRVREMGNRQLATQLR